MDGISLFISRITPPSLLFESVCFIAAITRTINSIALINNHAMTLSMLNDNKSAGRDRNHKLPPPLNALVAGYYRRG